MKRFLIMFAAVVHLVLADAIVKELAIGILRDSSVVTVIPGFFNLAYVENRGCAWGMFQGQVWPLAVFGIAALLFLIWKRKAVFSPAGWMMTVAEPMLYAGIVGNVIDRISRGCVIDMFDFYWRTYHYPCFNVADTLICVAVGLMVVAALCQSFRKQSR